jgi:hypothetical protein
MGLLMSAIGFLGCPFSSFTDGLANGPMNFVPPN